MSTQPPKQWKYLARKPGSNYRQFRNNKNAAAVRAKVKKGVARAAAQGK